MYVFYERKFKNSRSKNYRFFTPTTQLCTSRNQEHKQGRTGDFNSNLPLIFFLIKKVCPEEFSRYTDKNIIFYLSNKKILSKKGMKSQDQGFHKISCTLYVHF